MRVKLRTCACGLSMATEVFKKHRRVCRHYRAIRGIVVKRKAHRTHDMAGFKGTRRAEYLAERDMLQPLEA